MKVNGRSLALLLPLADKRSRLAVGRGCREQASRGRERESEADSGAALTWAILGRGTRKNTTLTGVLGLQSETTEREAGKRRSGSSVISAKA